MLEILAEAGVLWLQLTGGEPVIDKLFGDVYGATAEAYDGLTRQRGSFAKFERGLAVAHEAKLPINLNLIVARQNAHEVDEGLERHEWGVLQAGLLAAVEAYVDPHCQQQRHRPAKCVVGAHGRRDRNRAGAVSAFRTRGALQCQVRRSGGPGESHPRAPTPLLSP